MFKPIESVAVDFDGCLTLTDHYPFIEGINQEAISVLKAFQKAGGKVLLNTNREDIQLAYAVKALREEGFVPDTVNENLPERIAKFKGDSRKLGADRYIDNNCIDYTGDWQKYKSILLSPENIKHLRQKPRFKMNRT